MPRSSPTHLNLSLDQSSPARASSHKYWQESQFVFFETVKLRSSRRTEKRTRLDAYFESVTNSAMQGDQNAIREQARLRDYLERRDALFPPRVRSEGSLLVQRLIEEQARLYEYVSPWLVFAYVLETGLLARDYEQKHGRAPTFEFSRPYWLPEVDYEARFRRFVKKSESGDPTAPSDTDVGYGRPPVATRWKAGQSGNKSGTKKVEISGDSFAAFRASAVRSVPVLVQGRKTKLTSAAIVTRRLIDQATKGDAAARREVRALLIELDKRGLLKPPPPRRKKSRLFPNEPRMLSLMLRTPMLKICGFELRKEMEADHRKVYGRNPNFEAEIEQKLEYNRKLIEKALEQGGLRPNETP